MAGRRACCRGGGGAGRRACCWCCPHICLLMTSPMTYFSLSDTLWYTTSDDGELWPETDIICGILKPLPSIDTPVTLIDWYTIERGTFSDKTFKKVVSLSLPIGLFWNQQSSLGHTKPKDIARVCQQKQLIKYMLYYNI